ncbi:hypothetical protein CONPUDRAFT_125752 [Coniophora puteana RWD-64-598 SS2]|uniref:DUF6534 domain-containing protein n=1 Tax=Coniophora puteana (strain RWD-64-598) TaxID=741705 RepID=A0A5M3MJQ7_CONPW|nr:uncharacterized protein CONPUDRAFT_125752 [Coniophora puteana RWD-64-598 SS2]EIW79442.1 hypothetical protein CONPUDRAFT_125752 [Coniophora puteana RWD-64-598 SS2]
MGEYDKTIGVLIVGIFFNTYLYGLVMYQYARYKRAKFNDKWPIKAMVVFLFLLDGVHSASIIYMAWDYVVTNYTNPEALLWSPWPFPFTPIAVSLAAVTTQTFLALRIRRLSGNSLLFGIIIALSVASFAFGVTCGIKAWMISYIPDLIKIRHLVIPWLVLQVIVDVIVTATLVTLNARSCNKSSKTINVISQLVFGAKQTGLFAAIFALCDLISFLAAPTMNLYGMFAMPIGRIYTNTLLATLLSREVSRSRRATSGQVNLETETEFAATPAYTMTNVRLDEGKLDVHDAPASDGSRAPSPEQFKRTSGVHV